MRKKDAQPTTQTIDIVKGNPTTHERDAVIAAIVVASIAAAAVAATYAVKKEPRLLTPWKMIGDSRMGHGFESLRRQHKARRQQRERD